jgi:hypothetical protein
MAVGFAGGRDEAREDDDSASGRAQGGGRLWRAFMCHDCWAAARREGKMGNTTEVAPVTSKDGTTGRDMARKALDWVRRAVGVGSSSDAGVAGPGWAPGELEGGTTREGSWLLVHNKCHCCTTVGVCLFVANGCGDRQLPVLSRE